MGASMQTMQSPSSCNASEVQSVIISKALSAGPSALHPYHMLQCLLQQYSNNIAPHRRARCCRRHPIPASYVQRPVVVAVFAAAVPAFAGIRTAIYTAERIEEHSKVAYATDRHKPFERV